MAGETYKMLGTFFESPKSASLCEVGVLVRGSMEQMCRCLGEIKQTKYSPFSSSHFFHVFTCLHQFTGPPLACFQFKGLGGVVPILAIPLYHGCNTLFCCMSIDYVCVYPYIIVISLLRISGSLLTKEKSVSCTSHYVVESFRQIICLNLFPVSFVFLSIVVTTILNTVPEQSSLTLKWWLSVEMTGMPFPL